MQLEKGAEAPLFAFYIDFKPGEGRPQRIFEAAADLVSAFQLIDQTVCESFGSMATELRLEKIEAGSMKGFLRSVLLNIDDADLHDLNVKKIVGRFLLAAKYEVLDWANADENQRSPRKLNELSSRIQNIASATGVKRLPDYSKPSVEKLARSISQLSEAKATLGDEDKLYILSEGKKTEVTAMITWPPDELLEVLTEELISMVPGRAVLVIKKPDFLGKSKWHMRYKGHTERVKMGDEKWLLEYQLGRTEALGPGDALEVDLAVEHRKDKHGNIIEQQLTVTKVHAIHHQEFQMRFPEG